METRAVLLIFLLELETSRVVVYSIHQDSEKWYKQLPGENDFETVFATFCCYDYGANASVAVDWNSRISTVSR